MDKQNDIIEFWFSGLNDESQLHTDLPQFRKWFGKAEETDREIRERFQEDWTLAMEGRYLNWEQRPRETLALVILFDQFPRNMYRDTAKAFSSDSKALEVCLNALDQGQDESLALIERMFLYLPLMHSEDMDIQNKSMHYFSLLKDKAKEKSLQNIDFFNLNLEYAGKHCRIIDRFGRYPHRNYILGRLSTEEEVNFLKGPESSF